MAEGVNVRLSGALRQFIEERSGPTGLYENASEYIRDLIRHDFEREERQRWAWLTQALTPGMNAHEDEFQAFDPNQIIAEAKAEMDADES